MESSYFTQHTSSQFDEELEDIRDRVLTMGGLVEQQFADAMTALADDESDLARRVATGDYKVNALEVEIDEACSSILARRQPAARDLRLIVMAIKTITDLERIGDEAESIGRNALRLGDERPSRSHLTEIRHLGRHVGRMLHHSLNAYARIDLELALQVIREDSRIDEACDAAMRHLMTFMMEDPRQTSRMLNIIWVARSLERIGDHAKNIAEYVVYMKKGKDVRHVSVEQVEREIQG